MDIEVIRVLASKDRNQTYRIVTASGQQIYGTISVQPDGQTVFVGDDIAGATYVDAAKIESIAKT